LAGAAHSCALAFLGLTGSWHTDDDGAQRRSAAAAVFLDSGRIPVLPSGGSCEHAGASMRVKRFVEKERSACAGDTQLEGD
jgi:hypothetical protein